MSISCLKKGKNKQFSQGVKCMVIIFVQYVYVMCTYVYYVCLWVEKIMGKRSVAHFPTRNFLVRPVLYKEWWTYFIPWLMIDGESCFISKDICLSFWAFVLNKFYF